MIRYFAGAVAACALIAAGPASAQDKLTVFWGKGFYKAEDDALFAAVKKFEEKAKVKVDISQYPPQDMIPKTVAAMDSGTPPDVAYGDVFDFQVAGKWAFEGKLEDISDIINPLKGQFAPNTIETTFLHNDKTKKSAYYAFPMKQQTMHIQYWIDMLGQAGFKESDIPKDWKGYWDFWCSKVQAAYRQKTGTRMFAIGHPMGVDSSDSFYSFLTFMDAHNVKLVDDSGKLLVDDPKVREGLIGALKDYTDIYTRGCTPPSSSNWKDPDNNVAFHNKTSILTHNATISIVSKWVDDFEQCDAHARAARPGEEERRREHRDRRLPHQAGRQADGLSRGRESRRDLRGFEEQGESEGIRAVHAAGREPDALRRGCAWPLVPGDQDRTGLQVLARRSPQEGRARPVQGRHGDLRVHQELQVHHPQQ